MSQSEGRRAFLAGLNSVTWLFRLKASFGLLNLDDLLSSCNTSVKKNRNAQRLLYVVAERLELIDSYVPTNRDEETYRRMRDLFYAAEPEITPHLLRYCKLILLECKCDRRIINSVVEIQALLSIIEALAALRVTEATKLIGGFFREWRGNQENCDRLARNLRLVGGEEWKRTIFGLLENKDSLTHQVTRALLETIPDDQALNDLVSRIASDKTYPESVRTTILEYLGCKGDPTALRMLLQMLSNLVPLVRSERGLGSETDIACAIVSGISRADDLSVLQRLTPLVSKNDSLSSLLLRVFFKTAIRYPNRSLEKHLAHLVDEGIGNEIPRAALQLHRFSENERVTCEVAFASPHTLELRSPLGIVLEKTTAPTLSDSETVVVQELEKLLLNDLPATHSPDLIRKVGEDLYKRTGQRGMHKIYRGIHQRGANADRLSKIWNGIGTWRH
jgi:hypothetical protein